jgi:hypothetical protein
MFIAAAGDSDGVSGIKFLEENNVNLVDLFPDNQERIDRHSHETPVRS